MAVTATLHPERVTSSTGSAAGLSLRLSNHGDDGQLVTITPAGTLSSITSAQSDTVHLDAGETFEVPVLVDIGPAVVAGAHEAIVEVRSGDEQLTTAAASIEVLPWTEYTLRLVPERSRSGSTGRHRIDVDNTGNVPVAVEMIATTSAGARPVLTTTVITADPSDTGTAELRVEPIEKFWTGSPREHEVLITATGSDAQTHELRGVYEQLPRIRPWVGPAAAGAAAALLLIAIIWLGFLAPWVSDTADNAAAEALARDRALQDLRLAEFEAAAEAASELPFGSPYDLRLAVEPAEGSTSSASSTVATGVEISLTDVVFQNPSGAVGNVALRRDGDVLLESELANFRDLDFHFVAPFVFPAGSTIDITVDCITPGTEATTCDVGATLLGFAADEG
ncbi:MAG: hypothetical protein AAGF73_18970 [Actinomycetota bacterium]